MTDAISIADEASALAAEMSAGAGEEPIASDGSRKRSIPPELRNRFIAFRTILVQRGMIDPILQRFDSYTVEQAPTDEIAQRLREIAESFRG